MVTVSPAVTKPGDGVGVGRLELLASMGGLSGGRFVPLDAGVTAFDNGGDMILGICGWSRSCCCCCCDC